MELQTHKLEALHGAHGILSVFVFLERDPTLLVAHLESLELAEGLEDTLHILLRDHRPQVLDVELAHGGPAGLVGAAHLETTQHMLGDLLTSHHALRARGALVQLGVRALDHHRFAEDLVMRRRQRARPGHGQVLCKLDNDRARERIRPVAEDMHVADNAALAEVPEDDLLVGRRRDAQHDDGPLHLIHGAAEAAEAGYDSRIPALGQWRG
mmetsp:Transcript_8231/g.17847  ORF Transcript_8231/g.17847 Transcript_8231/m.17847 type:complete len:211 (-) Transcript_8231:272-904(-)